MTPPILLVALASSVHTWRWVQLIRGQGRPVVLLPATRDPPMPELAAAPRIGSSADFARLAPDAVAIWDHRSGAPPDDLPAPIGFGDRTPIVRGAEIAHAVQALRPAVLHSMEVQCAGYACLRATEQLGAAAPPWLVSNWGSDVFLYHRLAAHRPVLAAIARRMDASLNECARDLAILRSLGFRGAIHHVMPASGGMDFTPIPPLPSLPPASARSGIVVKGYHGWAGRGQHILSALHLAAPHLRRFRIGVVLARPQLAAAIASLAAADGLDIVAEPWEPDQAVALRRMAAARLMIGVGISDGIGTSLLEAMTFGAFPIVACTSCASEWIQHGRHGLIIDPHDIGALADAIRLAASDDLLVDNAAGPNRDLVERRWNRTANRAEALAVYAAVAGNGR